MIGCTRCGSWHEDAETAEGKKLSCTEVKQHWIKVRKEHNNQYGHYPKIIRNEDGKWICIECRRELCNRSPASHSRPTRPDGIA